MRKEVFQEYIEIRKEMEFKFKNQRYTITYGKDELGFDYIEVALLYEAGQRFSSYKQMMAECKIDNTFLKEFVDDIELI